MILTLRHQDEKWKRAFPPASPDAGQQWPLGKVFDLQMLAEDDPQNGSKGVV